MEKYQWQSQAAEDLHAEQRQNGRRASISSSSFVACASSLLNTLLCDIAKGVFVVVLDSNDSED